MRVRTVLTEALTEGVFDVHTAEQWITHIKSGVHAPYVSAYKSTLGGNDRVSIMLTISLDPKEAWANNILQNSRYMNMHLHNDATLQQISGSKLKFRKTRVVSADDVVAKLNKFIASVPKGD